MRPVLTRAVVREGIPLLVVVGLVFLALLQVSHTDWEEVFLYNGDSIVLPLLSQSFERGEPFWWVFSTQAFLFPEYPVYVLCSLIAGSVRGALLLNAFVNVVLLYVLLRGIARFVAPRRPLRQVVAASAAVTIFMVCVLAEPAAHLRFPGIVDPGSIATLFLLTTYYYGVILVGLATVLLVLWFTRALRLGALGRRRILIYCALIIVLGTLTMYSNPLYLLQVILPLGVAVVGLWIGRRMPLRWLIAVLAPLAVAVLLGGIARLVFAQYLASNFGSYLGPSLILQSAWTLLVTVGVWFTTPAGVLKFVLVAVPVVVMLVFGVRIAIALVRTRRRPDGPGSRGDTIDAFLILFAASSALSLVVGHVGTGQLLTRYLVPLFIFPLLGVLLLAKPGSFGRRVSAQPAPRRAAIVVGALAAAVLATGAIVVSIPAVAAMTSERYAPADCLNDWLGGSDASGVGPFMVSRPIALYGDQEGRLVQVVDSVVVQPWMNNLAQYVGGGFSYVLLDERSDPADVIETLGEPADIVECATFTIVDYAGTPGEQSLNDWVADTLQPQLDARGYTR